MPRVARGRCAAYIAGLSKQAVQKIVSESFRNFRGGERARRAVPKNAPVQCTQQRASGEGRIAWHEFAGTSPRHNHLSHAIFVTIALGYQTPVQMSRQGTGQIMRGGTFDFVEDTPQMRDDDETKPVCDGCSRSPGLFQRRQHAVEGIVLAEIENFMFSAKIIVEVCGRKGSGGSDVAHAGLGKASHAILASGGAQYLQAPRQVAPANTPMATTHDSADRQFNSPGLS